MRYLRIGLLHHHGNPQSGEGSFQNLVVLARLLRQAADWPAPLEKGRLMPIHQITGLYRLHQPAQKFKLKLPIRRKLEKRKREELGHRAAQLLLEVIDIFLQCASIVVKKPPLGQVFFFSNAPRPAC